MTSTFILQVSLHNYYLRQKKNQQFFKGQNVWLNFDQKPKYISKVTLNTNDAAWAKIHLAKEVSTAISDCSDTAVPETCFKDELESQLNTQLICQPVTLAYFDLVLSTCNNSANAAYAIEKANAKAEAIDCEKKCTVEKFLVDHVEYLQKESYTSPELLEDNEFKLVLTYDETTVTLMKEFYIYDGIDMVMAVGGILAFFLGFSVLSVLLDCVDIVYKACGNQDDTKISVFKRSFRQ